uniref:Uncharacterized protein n=1 Tax=Suricata suricatta TaxID=37032 RepID=A0A673T0C1_SURSU
AQTQPELCTTSETWAMADLSEDTFPAEVQSSSSFSSSGGLQPGSQASGSRPESGELTTPLECRDRQSELSDYKNPEKKFSRKWINYLKGKETNSGQYQPDAKPPTEITQVSDQELNALQSFCAVKISLIRHRAILKEKKSSRPKKPPLRLDAEASEADALNCIVPDELLNRIYLKNIRTAPKQVATEKQHISSQCPGCNRKRSELAQSAFLRRKKTLLESLLLQEKIDERLYTKDFLTHIRDAHQGLPRRKHKS